MSGTIEMWQGKIIYTIYVPTTASYLHLAIKLTQLNIAILELRRASMIKLIHPVILLSGAAF